MRFNFLMGDKLPMVTAVKQTTYKLGLVRTRDRVNVKSKLEIESERVHNQKKALNQELRQVFHHMVHPNVPYSITNLLEQNGALPVPSYLGFEDIILFERASKQLNQSIRKYYDGVIICQANQMRRVRCIYPQATLRHICDSEEQIELCEGNGIPIPNLLTIGGHRQVVDISSQDQILRAVIEHNDNEYDIIGSKECPIIFENGWVKECQTFHVKQPKIRVELIGEKGVPVKFNGSNMPESCKELRKKNTNNGCQTIYYESSETPVILSGDNTYRPIKYKTKKEWNHGNESSSISLIFRGAYQKVNSNQTQII